MIIFSIIIVIVLVSDFAKFWTLIGYEPELGLKLLTADGTVNNNKQLGSKHHIHLGPRRYLELSPCSKGYGEPVNLFRAPSGY